MVLKLQKKIKTLQGQINNLFSESQVEMTTETDLFKHAVQKNIKRLGVIKQEQAGSKTTSPDDNTLHHTIEEE